MSGKIITRLVAGCLGLAMLFQLGCAGRSKQARFYVLTPETAAGHEMQQGAGISSDIVIGISPVVLPKYLKKQQIVTRTGANELQLAEYHRWAGKIEEDIGRVIAENLSLLLGTDRVLASPAREGIVPDYDIRIDITRFDGRLGGEVELSARWAVFDGGGRDLSGVKATVITRPVQGGDYGQLVAAQSGALATFSRQLAAVIKQLTGG
jgi:uncharacterized lipoprotein YmbA